MVRWEILRTSLPTAIAKYIIPLLLLNEITNKYGWSNAECEGGAQGWSIHANVSEVTEEPCLQVDDGIIFNINGSSSNNNNRSRKLASC